MRFGAGHRVSGVIPIPGYPTSGTNLHYVVRAFVQLREMLTSNKKLAQRLDELERKLATHDQAITGIIKTIRELMNPPEPKKRPIGFVKLEEKK